MKGGPFFAHRMLGKSGVLCGVEWEGVMGTDVGQRERPGWRGPWTEKKLVSLRFKRWVVMQPMTVVEGRR